MFEKLTVLSWQRTRKQAFGFYLAGLFYAFVLVLLGGLTGAATHHSNARDGFTAGCHAGAVFAAAFCTVAAFLIVRRKQLDAVHYGYVVVTAVSAILAGPVAGMIVPACLSMQASTPINPQRSPMHGAALETLEKESV